MEHRNIESQLENLFSISREKTLLIYVINQNTRSSNHFKANKLCDEKISAFVVKTHKSDQLNEHIRYLHSTSHAIDILVIDAYTQPLRHKEGVGKARKIGCDLAAILKLNNAIEDPGLYSSDGDVFFPGDYFNESESANEKISLIMKSYTHDDSRLECQHERLAIKAYDFFLLNHPSSLKKAGSTYGFHTIGSCFYINFASYAKVRGFPNRQAGEDFHLAMKLSKIGLVINSSLTPLKILARVSDRVPFGTGPSIAEIARNFRENRPYEIFSADSYKALKYLLDFCNRYFNMNKNDLPAHIAQDFVTNADIGLDTTLVAKYLTIIQSAKVFENLERAHRCSSFIEVRRKNFFDWLDGLKQLQILNHLSKEIAPKRKIWSQCIPTFVYDLDHKEK